MTLRTTIEFSVILASTSLGLAFGTLSVELVRLLVDKKRRTEQIERIRLFGLRAVIWKALTGDPQSELLLKSHHAA